ncbi:hypothetical protein MUJ63_07640 [Lachnospiraceae bacterium NSJ-143]|nr:hypothetical protein [Lachnospiraceae bacterium NSJ-143]
MEKLFRKILKGVNSVSGLDVTLLMACVGAVGLLLGMNITEKGKKAVSVVSVFVFIVTSIPAISKIAGKMLNNDVDDYFSDDDCFEPEV